MNNTGEITVPLESSTSNCSYLNYLVFFCFLLGAYKVFNLLWEIFASFWIKPLNLKKRYGGGWALITGGSEGIGLSIAEELAKLGFNIILVSRSVNKLKTAQ